MRNQVQSIYYDEETEAVYDEETKQLIGFGRYKRGMLIVQPLNLRAK